MTKENLKQFAISWKEGNFEALLEFFTEDASYSASIGPEPGKTYHGLKEIGNGIRTMIKNDQGSIPVVENIKIHGNFGFWEWTYLFPDGSEQRGCDVFQFNGNKIKFKNAFRKVKKTY